VVATYRACRRPRRPSHRARGLSAEEFLTKTAKANQFEIDASKLAVDKAKSKEVKDLAQALVSDHTAAAEKLKAPVPADGKLTLPKDDKPKAKHARTLDKLNGASGDTFGRAYLEAMLTGDKNSLERYRRYGATGDNANLKQFAQEIAPIVERHLTARKARACERTPAAQVARSQGCTGSATARRGEGQ
jgi:putative membrane protein